MASTEVKAQEKAKELIEYYTDNKGVNLSEGSLCYKMNKEDAVSRSVFSCDQTIDALNSVKGMGKIHKVKLWKRVKEILEDGE